MMPSFTVVVPCFNAASFISATLRSVQAQTLEDWQLIVVDDGSTDKSREFVSRLAAEDPRIQLVVQEKAGVSAARNRGAELAAGEFIAFLDADDLWHPEFLAAMAVFMRSDPARAVGFACVAFIDQLGHPTGLRSRGRLSGLTIADLLSANPTLTSSNIVIRPAVFRALAGFRIGLNHAEDQLLLLRVGLHGHRIEGYRRELVYYRTNPNGLSADLEGMHRGWCYMRDIANAEFPDQIQRHENNAKCRNLLYLARRALRLTNARGQALGFVLRAVTSHPPILWIRPWPTVPLLAVSALDALRLSLLNCKFFSWSAK